MSETYRLELYDAEGANPRLRWYTPDRTMAERRLDREAVDAFIARVSAEYSKYSPDLPALGTDLYRWLDGPTERWLRSAQDRAVPLVMYLAAQERLRGLPWELMFDESFVAVRPARPITPVRAVSNRSGERIEPANRPLRVLFMASSPIGVKPVLDFEQEEGAILAAAAGRVEVVVEESGSLAGLKALLTWFGPGYFDVLHLTGHGYIGSDGPRFVMEGADGGRADQSAAEIADAVQGHWPGLVFVSGCYTAGAPGSGAVASMSEALVEAGAPVVLGWALPVGDIAASNLAASLYGSLADGATIVEAVTVARRRLFQDYSVDWHLLRLYADQTPLGSLVTAPGTRGRVRLRTRGSSTLFLDAEGRVKVADRESFVGRRRELQRLLQALRPDDPTQGPQVVLLHGMGGLGKSTLAARLLERLRSTHEQHAVWVGRLDAQEIVSLTQKLSLPFDVDQQVNELLSRDKIPLADRLRYILDGPLADMPCVFVFDDFEDGNLEPDGHGGHVLTPAALDVLRAFTTAIARTGSPSRVIVTSRYDLLVPPGVQVLRQPVSELQGTDLEKKLRSLEYLGPLGPVGLVPDVVKERAITAAAGVPRLLERLDSLIGASPTNIDELLATIEDTAVEYREELLLQQLLDSQSPQIRRVIALASVYEIAVPGEAILGLSPDQPIEADLQAAVGAGLIQAGIHPSTNELRYLVSPLLRPLLEKQPERLDDTELRIAQERAVDVLYRLWVEPDGE